MCCAAGTSSAALRHPMRPPVRGPRATAPTGATARCTTRWGPSSCWPRATSCSSRVRAVPCCAVLCCACCAVLCCAVWAVVRCGSVVLRLPGSACPGPSPLLPTHRCPALPRRPAGPRDRGGGLARPAALRLVSRAAGRPRHLCCLQHQRSAAGGPGPGGERRGAAAAVPPALRPTQPHPAPPAPPRRPQASACRPTPLAPWDRAPATMSPPQSWCRR